MRQLLNVELTGKLYWLSHWNMNRPAPCTNQARATDWYNFHRLQCCTAICYVLSSLHERLTSYNVSIGSVTSYHDDVTRHNVTSSWYTTTLKTHLSVNTSYKLYIVRYSSFPTKNVIFTPTPIYFYISECFIICSYLTLWGTSIFL